MDNILVYPAVFDYSEPPGPSITFPDFPGLLSEADNNADALRMARDALSGRIYILERENIPLPEPSNPAKLSASLEASQSVALIDVNMTRYNRRQDERKNVNKMVTLPQWLISEAKEAGINFSHTLRDALIEKLRE